MGKAAPFHGGAAFPEGAVAALEKFSVLGGLASVRVDGAVGLVETGAAARKLGRWNQSGGGCGHPQKWCRDNRCRGRGVGDGVGRNCGWEDGIEVRQSGRRESSIGGQG